MQLRRSTPRLRARHEAEVGGRPLPRWTTARGQTESHDPRTNSASESQKLGESHERENATNAVLDALPFPDPALRPDTAGATLETPEHGGSHYAARGGRRASPTSGGKLSVIATPAGAQRCGSSRSLSPSGKAIRSGASFAPVSSPRSTRGRTSRRACRPLMATKAGTSPRGTTPNSTACSRSDCTLTSSRLPAASAATNSRTRPAKASGASNIRMKRI